MAKILPRVLPWLPSAKDDSDQLTRVLGREDTPALLAMLDKDPVSNIFLRAQVDQHGTAAPDGFARILAPSDPAQLVNACWVGANIVPTPMAPSLAQIYARRAMATRQRFASVFGPSEAVMAMEPILARGSQQIFDVRPNQPLLVMDDLSPVEPSPTLRPATIDDFDAVLPASAAMFEEELGYSPLSSGGGYYRSRVRQMLRNGHTFIDVDQYGEIIFKADLGTVTSQATQIQGVWINPRYRGQSLAANYMAAVVNHALTFAPVVSLYVNDYNEPALRTYERVGFRQIGTFATILF